MGILNIYKKIIMILIRGKNRWSYFFLKVYFHKTAYINFVNSVHTDILSQFFNVFLCYFLENFKQIPKITSP